jgi:hypothetical protein
MRKKKILNKKIKPNAIKIVYASKFEVARATKKCLKKISGCVSRIGKAFNLYLRAI